MKTITRFVAVTLLGSLAAGCSGSGQWLPALSSPAEDWAVKKVTSKWKGGPEFRHNSRDQDATRWTTQTGLEAELYNGQKVGVTYRRRDVGQAAGFAESDDGVWLEYSFPLWVDKSRPNKEKELAARVEALEQMLQRQGVDTGDSGS